MAICGPKLSACGMVISVWGIIMLGLLGIFFRIHSPALIDDVPLNETQWEIDNYSAKYIYGLYDQIALNCWIAAGMYVVVLGFSFIQYRINLRANYVMS